MELILSSNPRFTKASYTLESTWPLISLNLEIANPELETAVEAPTEAALFVVVVVVVPNV
ncbi:hypothetical protein [Anaerobutyricum hallii]|uniref:hypothetical protein n=1 Tax=Anaerobutyricum hallii TaxID=39488 RepID=UPI003520A03E